MTVLTEEQNGPTYFKMIVPGARSRMGWRAGRGWSVCSKGRSREASVEAPITTQAGDTPPPACGGSRGGGSETGRILEMC